MTRLRVLELPSEVVGEDVKPVYAYVIDGVGDSVPFDELQDLCARMRRGSSARDVMIFRDRIELDQ